MTSHDVIGVLRRITGVRQIGHTGTLDPFAVGVLPLAVGKAARLIEYLDDDKAYIGRFNFGRTTATYDLEGEITEIFDRKVTREDISDVLKSFEGGIEQIPPIYSAIKSGGKKLYEYAREGIEVEIKPRKVYIEKIELIDFNYDNQYADIYIECSRGTYIRSIAYDLGKLTGAGGYLSKLERVSAGRFILADSVKLGDIKSVTDVEERLLNPLDYLSQPCQELDDIEYERVQHGMPVCSRIGVISGIVLLTRCNKIIAVSEHNGSVLSPKKVMI
ncbi:MAG: tRNA pseudouridine(55) synthase TruB [Candidatus Gastranaerophilales bacterium]|nr:tRNA pseudouridine(55) synthase TruB [Candidatus Gastranaerophilales bacterium]